MSLHFERPTHQQDKPNKRLYEIIDRLNLDLTYLKAAKEYLAIGEDLRTEFGEKSDRWRSHCLRHEFRAADYAAARESWCSEIDGYEARLQEGLRQVKQVLELGADVNADGGHALWRACSGGNTALIKALHGAGASLERKTDGFCRYYGDFFGATYECGADHVDAAKLLLELGCQASDIDVFYAKQSLSRGVVDLLKSCGLSARSPGGDPRVFFCGPR